MHELTCMRAVLQLTKLAATILIEEIVFILDTYLIVKLPMVLNLFLE